MAGDPVIIDGKGRDYTQVLDQRIVAILADYTSHLESHSMLWRCGLLVRGVTGM
ncbi:hypothetical protein Dimus_037194 [Dionaea muscipula]